PAGEGRRPPRPGRADEPTDQPRALPVGQHCGNTSCARLPEAWHRPPQRAHRPRARLTELTTWPDCCDPAPLQHAGPSNHAARPPSQMDPATLLGFPFPVDTSLAVLRLIGAGLFDRNPVIVTAHLGGALTPQGVSTCVQARQGSL